MASEHVFCQPSRNLRDLYGMGEAIVERETFMSTDNLRYTEETTERIAI